jgi:hypothetical protein
MRWLILVLSGCSLQQLPKAPNEGERRRSQHRNEPQQVESILAADFDRQHQSADYKR